MANVRRKLSNIIQLGLKELRSLYRDPAMLVLIILGWTMGLRISLLVLSAIPLSSAVALIFLQFFYHQKQHSQNLCLFYPDKFQLILPLNHLILFSYFVQFYE